MSTNALNYLNQPITFSANFSDVFSNSDISIVEYASLYSSMLNLSFLVAIVLGGPTLGLRASIHVPG
jgi:hypothetical protein